MRFNGCGLQICDEHCRKITKKFPLGYFGFKTEEECKDDELKLWHCASEDCISKYQKAYTAYLEKEANNKRNKIKRNNMFIIFFICGCVLIFGITLLLIVINI